METTKPAVIPSNEERNLQAFGWTSPGSLSPMLQSATPGTPDPSPECLDAYFEMKNHPSLTQRSDEFLCAWLGGKNCPTSTGGKLYDLNSAYRVFNAKTDMNDYDTFKANFELACVVANGTFCGEEYNVTSTLNKYSDPTYGAPDSSTTLFTRFQEYPLCKPRQACTAQEMVPMSIAEINTEMSGWNNVYVNNHIRCHQYTDKEIDYFLEKADELGFTQAYSATYADYDAQYHGYTRPGHGVKPEDIENSTVQGSSGTEIAALQSSSSPEISTRQSSSATEFEALQSSYTSGELTALNKTSSDGFGMQMGFIGGGITGLIAFVGLGYLALRKKRQNKDVGNKSGADDLEWDRDDEPKQKMESPRRSFTAPTPVFMLKRLRSYKQKMSITSFSVGNPYQSSQSLASMADLQHHDLGVREDGAVEVQLPFSTSRYRETFDF